MSSTKDTLKQMQDAVVAINARFDALNTRFGALDVEIASLKKMIKTASKSESETEVKVKKERKKTPKANKSDGEEKSDSEEKEKAKVKREVKPSPARDAWRSLCDAVRAVHKKDAMRIAKILKEAGHMTPTTQQIEAAASQLPASETPAKVSTDGEASDSGASSQAKKRGRPKKVASEE